VFSVVCRGKANIDRDETRCLIQCQRPIDDDGVMRKVGSLAY
jgi:hypothetical protein